MERALMVAYSLTIVGLLVASLWYVPHRLSRLLGWTRRWPLVVGVVAVAVLYVTSMSLVGKTTHAWLGNVTLVASVLFGFHLSLALSLLVLDALRWMLRIPDRLTAVAAVGVAALLVIVGVWRAYTLEVVEVDVPLTGLAQDVTVMHVSDVHLGHQRGRAWLERIVEEANRRRPDLVVWNGDLIESNLALEEGALEPLAHLEAPAFFTTGNHESHVDTVRLLAELARYGVRVLRNEVVELHGLQIAGLDYMNADEHAVDLHVVNAMTIKEELPKIPLDANRPILLLHHSPVGLAYASRRGVGLMLSGHTHAGQIFPATWIARFQFPRLRGLYAEGGTTLFVSQGAGTFGLPMRLGSSNQVEILRLRPAGVGADSPGTR